jgi:deoxyhypusine synthase
MASPPKGASAAVLKPSEPVPEEAVAVQGPNFDERLTLDSLLGSYERIGFQANSLGKAINIVNKMVRLAHHQLKLVVMQSIFAASLAPFR